MNKKDKKCDCVNCDKMKISQAAKSGEKLSSCENLSAKHHKRNEVEITKLDKAAKASELDINPMRKDINETDNKVTVNSLRKSKIIKSRSSPESKLKVKNNKVPEKGTIESCFERIKKKKEEQNERNIEKKEKITVSKDKIDKENSNKKSGKKQAPQTFSDIFSHRVTQKENASTCLNKRKKGMQRKKEKSVDLKNQMSIKHFLRDNDSSIEGKSQNAKRKLENIDEITSIGTQETPLKKKILEG